jgi:hypothetical protein
MAMPVAAFVTSPHDTVCEHTLVTLTAAPLYGGDAPAFAWRVNGTPVSTGMSYTYAPANGDIVNYTLTSNYRCRLANTVTSADVELTVEPILVPHVVISADPGLTIPVGTPVTLTAIAYDAGPAPVYQWKVNGYPVAGATEAVYTAVFHDYDSIICDVVSSGVCHNIGTSDWVFITMVPTSVHAAGGLQSDIRLLPNPTNGTFTIRGMITNGGSGDVQADITNMLGQAVYRGAIRQNQGKIDAQIILDNTLANGMYILTLRAEEGKESFHFVLER